MAEMGGASAPDRRRLRGQTVVELALLLPVLSLLFLGALDLGRVFYSYAAVANATRVGAQYLLDGARMDALLDDVTPTELMAEAENAIILEASPYVTLDPARINFTYSSWTSNADITIETAYDFHFLTPGAAQLWGNPLTITYSSTVRFK